MEKIFKLKENHTTIKQEIFAGVTTFLTMSYIIFINPNILQAAGMTLGAVFVATCIVAALGSLLMAFLANYPIAVAPGMAINVYFTYVIVHELGYSWQRALGIVFIAGVIFFLITFTKIRRWVIDAIPASLATALGAGIGIFIALLAFKNSAIIQAKPDAMIHWGQIESWSTLLFVLGFFLIVILDYLQVVGAMVIGILVITLVGVLCGVSHYDGIFAYPPSLRSTYFALDVKDIFHLQSINVIFALFLVMFFDGTGTLVGLLQQQPELMQSRLPRLARGLFADSLATLVAPLLGTTSTSPFIESAAGIRVGGRTGLTALTVAILFVCALFLSPLAKTIPDYAVSPALLYVGILMVKSAVRLNWRSVSEIIPAIVTMITIPFTFSIADGFGCGVISYVVIKLCVGKIKDLNLMLVILGLLFILYFIFRPHT